MIYDVANLDRIHLSLQIRHRGTARLCGLCYASNCRRALIQLVFLYLLFHSHELLWHFHGTHYIVIKLQWLSTVSTERFQLLPVCVLLRFIVPPEPNGPRIQSAFPNERMLQSHQYGTNPGLINAAHQIDSHRPSTKLTKNTPRFD